MSTAANNNPALAPPKSPLVKMLTSLKKLIITEFLWLFCAALVSVPITFIAVGFVRSHPGLLADVQKVIGPARLFSKTYLLIFFGLYFARLVAGAIQAQAATILPKK
jgi:hypothetical protein